VCRGPADKGLRCEDQGCVPAAESAVDKSVGEFLSNFIVFEICPKLFFRIMTEIVVLSDLAMGFHD